MAIGRYYATIGIDKTNTRREFRATRTKYQLAGARSPTIPQILLCLVQDREDTPYAFCSPTFI